MVVLKKVDILWLLYRLENGRLIVSVEELMERIQFGKWPTVLIGSRVCINWFLNERLETFDRTYSFVKC